MTHAGDLRQLGIRGRYAYALACVEVLCRAWAVTDPYVLDEVAAHWLALEAQFACT